MSEVRKAVQQFLERRPDVAAVQLGAHTRLAPSTCRHFLDGDLKWGVQTAEKEFARVLRLAEAGDILPVGAEPVTITEQHADVVKRVKRSHDFYQIETTRRVGQVLTFCAEHAAIGVITGAYGVGKSEALKAWRRGAGKQVENVSVEFDEFMAANVVDFIENLADLFGVEYAPGMHNGGRTFRALCAHLVEHHCLVVFDQCEAVRPRVLQVIRQIHDRTRDAGVGIVILAAPVLMERLQVSKMRDLGALSSRVGIWAQLTGLSRPEMAAIVKQEGILEVDKDAFDLWSRAVAGSMRRLMASVELIQARHSGKRVTVKTIAGVASHLWGMAIPGIEAAA